MNNVKSWRIVLDMIAKYKGDDAQCFNPAHDEIFLNIDEDDVSPDSTDGKLLQRIGCIYEDGMGWKTFASL